MGLSVTMMGRGWGGVDGKRKRGERLIAVRMNVLQ